MSTESQLTRRLCGAMELRGAITCAIVGNVMQGRGWPDRYVAWRDWNGWLEFKSRDGVLGVTQRVTLIRLRAMGHVQCWVVRYLDGLNQMQVEWVDGSVHAMALNVGGLMTELVRLKEVRI